MIDVLPLLLGDDGYQISRSVRLRSSASAYFSRTPASSGNRTTWTLSVWAKRGTISASTINSIYSAGTSGTNDSNISFNGDVLDFFNRNSSTINGRLITTQVFRDPSSWYHIVFVWNTTSATSSNRMQIYLNGSQVTAFSTATYPSQNQTSNVNNAVSNLLGLQTGTSNYFDGYLTEINFIDGLTPNTTTRTVGGVTQTVLTELGEFDTVTGVWKPVRWTRSFGTNGFYLNFSDNSAATAAAIGKDYSGLGNNWTPNNISVTAGATYDSMLDVPTPWADGGNGRGNYATWNPLTAGGLVTFSEANLKALSTSASAPSNIESTIKTATTGKWYAEVTMAAGASNPAVGIGNNPSASGSNTDQYAAYRVNATYITSGIGSSTGTPSTFTTNDVIGIAYDADAGTLVFYKNGTLQTGGFTGITAGNYSFIVRKDSASGDGGYLNCGQRPFTYTPPSGFKALNTQNLPTPTILKGNQYFDVALWTGNGSARSITGTPFQPDLVWIKGRSGATDHALYDAVRGVQLDLVSNSTAAETTQSTGLTAFNSDGFSIGTLAKLNTNTATYVGWQWKEGATQGFDIVTYTGTGTNRTVAHNLGVAPRMMLVKNRTTATGWLVYHASVGNTGALILNSTSATVTSSDYWNNTTPTSSEFTLGISNAGNQSGNSLVAYLFAEVAGFSKFGSYTGNGSANGPFVFCGFRPRFVLVKESSAAGNNWVIYDTARDTYNECSNILYTNLPNAEFNGLTVNLDILSNGFKPRDNWGGNNTSGSTYIFAAFAENPMKYALAR